MDFVSALQSEKVGGREGIRTPDPLLAKQVGGTLNSFVGVAYTENRRNSRSSNVPTLSRTATIGVSLTRKINGNPAPQMSRISKPRTLSELFVDSIRPTLTHAGSLLSAASSVNARRLPITNRGK